MAIYIAARIYRTGLLMYGKRPTFREMARWVREGLGQGGAGGSTGGTVLEDT